MQILRIISHLMDYPSAELQSNLHDLKASIKTVREISPRQREELLTLVDSVYNCDLLDAQERYTSLFDSGRHLSLLLFEHVHGESRDRGQAMVDLMASYQQHGLQISVRELPDYIPLYLEYLSRCPDLEARQGLADVSHILAMLCARLQQRDSIYSALFSALLTISGATEDIAAMRAQAASETPDNTPEALDKIWEEEAITFGADNEQSSCSLHSRQAKETVKTTPVHWVNANQQTASST